MMLRTPLARVAFLMVLAAGVPARADIPEPEAKVPASMSQEKAALTAALRRRDVEGAGTAIRNLVRLRRIHEIPDLTHVATVFLARFDDAVVGAPNDAVVRLATQAVDLAPGLPELRFRLARTQLGQGVDHIGPASSAFLAGLSLLADHPRSALVLLGNIAFYLLWALLFLSVLGTAALLFRNGRALAHDLGDVFPASPGAAFSAPEVARSRRLRVLIGSGLNRALALSILLLTLLLPLAIGAGLLATLVVWLVLASLHARRAELIAVVLLLIALGTIPLLGVGLRVPAAAESAEGGSLWSLLREDGAESARRRVADRTTDPGAPWPRIALALQEVQAGPTDLPRLGAADELLAGTAGDGSGAASVLSGNVAVLRSLLLCTKGTPDAASLAAARKSYEDALQRRPGAPEALRGLAVAEGLSGARDAMEKTLNRLLAQVADDELDFIARIRTLTGPSEACRSVEALAAELRPPTIPAWPIYFRGVDVVALAPALPLGSILRGFLPGGALPILALLGILAVAVVLTIRGRLRLASICPRCGTVSCGRCNERASGFDYCPTCLFEQVKPAFLDPLDLVALQRRSEDRLQARRHVEPILGMLLPGMGQVLAGRPIRGLIMLGVLGAAVAMVLSPVPPLVDIHAFQGQAGGLPAAPPVMLAVIYLWSAIDLWVNRRR